VRDEGDDRTDRLAARVRADAARMREHGVDVTVYDDAADLGERFPELVTGDIAVAAVAESAGYANPGEYTRTMGLLARARGAELREGTPATLTAEGAVATDDATHEHDAVVVAAGAHTARVVADIAPLAVKPYRVQALVTERADVDVPMCYDATNGFYLRPREGGLLVGDGTEPVEQDPDGWDREADSEFRESCVEYQERALGWSWPEARSWAGLCTATPDGDPLVGAVADGVYVATGFQGHGFMWAPAVAERLAAQVLGEKAGIEGFAPGRFDGDESFEIVEGMRLE
jgi:glycine/D-amino acid oxidase-like deaminating enzyme